MRFKPGDLEFLRGLEDDGEIIPELEGEPVDMPYHCAVALEDFGRLRATAVPGQPIRTIDAVAYADGVGVICLVDWLDLIIAADSVFLAWIDKRQVPVKKNP